MIALILLEAIARGVDNQFSSPENGDIGDGAHPRNHVKQSEKASNSCLALREAFRVLERPYAGNCRLANFNIPAIACQVKIILTK
jgi:hypothetical protein